MLGEETVYLKMPCAMTTAKEIGQLRMPSIAGIGRADEADVRVVSAADVKPTPRVAALPDRRRRSCARLCPTATKRARPLRARRSEQAAKLAEIIEGMA